jgi:hypothetical protein
MHCNVARKKIFRDRTPTRSTPPSCFLLVLLPIIDSLYSFYASERRQLASEVVKWENSPSSPHPSHQNSENRSPSPVAYRTEEKEKNLTEDFEGVN